MSSSRIAPADLRSLLESGDKPILLHVLSDEAFVEKRLPDSKHACVYEVAFLDKVAELAPDHSVSIIAYGLNDSFGASALAFERLQDAGYKRVRTLAGGLDAWESAGFSVEGAGESASRIEDGGYDVDPDQSVFRWTGRNLFNQHHGRIPFQSGHLKIDNGQLAAGSVVLDMTAITCSDLKDEGMHKALINHLESDDFFSASNFPRAQFQIRAVKPISEARPGDFNLEVEGTLSLRGVEQPVQFESQIAFLGDRLGLQGQFDVDRTRFGSVYGSGKIFEQLGQHVVNDRISVSFQLICPVKN